MSKKVGFIVILAIIAATIAVNPFAGRVAHADEVMEFVTASASCESGSYTFEVFGGQVEGRDVAVIGGNTAVEAWDSMGTFLGQNVYNLEPGNYQISGSITFSQQPVGNVTFRLYYDEGFFVLPSALAEPGDILADSITVPNGCEPTLAPGCDVQISLAGAVSGAFVETTSAFWGPSYMKETNPLVTITAGKTLYVFGQDSSEEFYKVLLVCQFLWVPKSTVGPNYDAVWQGTPLPTTIVE